MTDRGHVPAYVRDMFGAALEYGKTNGKWWEWFVTERADQFLWRERDGGRWEQLDAKERATWIVDQLATSTAIAPDHILALYGLGPGQTYAELARRVRRDVAGEETVLDHWGADDASSVALHVTIPRVLMDQLETIRNRMGMTLDEAVRHALTEWVS